LGITNVIATLLLTRFASGHTLGLSTSDFEVQPSGAVEARFVFASAEALRGVRLDRDGDGVVTEGEVAAARGELRAFVASGIDVAVDGERCPLTFRDATLQEIDGLVIRASYACAPARERVTATLYYLNDLGPDHREVARISAGGGTTEETVLTRDRREITLRMRAPAAPRDQGSRRAYAAAMVAAVLVVLGVGLRAWLRARRSDA
jgi:hypothetical protein